MDVFFEVNFFDLVNKLIILGNMLNYFNIVRGILNRILLIMVVLLLIVGMLVIFVIFWMWFDLRMNLC